MIEAENHLVEDDDQLDEDEIDLLMASVHDREELQPDELARMEWAKRFTQRNNNISRGILPMAKRVGQPVHFR